MIDLRRFCNEHKSHMANPVRVDDWVLGTDGHILVAMKVSMLGAVDLADNAWLREAMDRPATEGIAPEFLRLLKLPRQHRVPLDVLRRWSLEVDIDAWTLSDCDHCGGGRLLADRQHFDDEIIVDRALVRRCLYPLRRDCIAEVGTAGAVGPITVYLGDIFIVVMPQRPGDAVGDDPFGLEAYVDPTAVGFA